jgi:hypothetical protein
MRRKKSFWFLSVLVSSLSLGLSGLPGLWSVAQAQGGFGIGIGTGSWFGPGLWGGGGHYNGGGFYGMGVTLRPSHYTAPITRFDTDTRPNAKKEQAATKYGVLEGFIRLCPPQASPNPQATPTTGLTGTTSTQSVVKPSGPCAASPAELQQVAVVASPYGMSQWVSTLPDTTGHYRLTLMPGGYLIQAGNPEIKNQRPVEVIVEPGKTTRHDFQLGP